MTYLKVKLWGQEIGRLVWDSATRRAYFMFNPEEKNKIPDIIPLLSPTGTRNYLLPIYGDERPLYQGLPPFIADSLPDSWGNTLFDRWVKNNKIPRNKVTPLYKLMFIGKRGMGALEYEPYAAEFAQTRTLDIKSLYEMSLQVLEDRDNVVLNTSGELTLQALLTVGTSAGGRQMKAVIAINDKTGEIRSGQTDGLDGFDYYILKFGDSIMPISEIEVAFYNIAIAAGIEMEDCRLLEVEGVNHFVTKRFDRANGKKIYVQTLAAINPEASSYEDIIATCRELSLSESDIQQLYTRMVFNVMANNTDDHNKNFSFLMEENGKWRLAPAYDMTFIFNINGTGPNNERRMSIDGKTSEITKADLLDFAKQNGINNAGAIINRVAKSIFTGIDECYRVSQPWRSIIRKTLLEKLKKFGFIDENHNAELPFSDKHHRTITKLSLEINSKRHFVVSAVINGKRKRRFVRPNMDFYNDIAEQDIYNLSINEKIRLIEVLFPPDEN